MSAKAEALAAWLVRQRDAVTEQLGVTLQSSAYGACLFWLSLSVGPWRSRRCWTLVREDRANKRAVIRTSSL